MAGMSCVINGRYTTWLTAAGCARDGRKPGEACVARTPVESVSAMLTSSASLSPFLFRNMLSPSDNRERPARLQAVDAGAAVQPGQPRSVARLPRLYYYQDQADYSGSHSHRDRAL